MADTPNRKSTRTFDLSKPAKRRFDLSKSEEPSVAPPTEKKSGSKKWLWGVLGGVALIGGVAYFATRDGDKTIQPADNTQVAEQTVSPKTEQPVAETVPTEQFSEKASEPEQTPKDVATTTEPSSTSAKEQPTEKPTEKKKEKKADVPAQQTNNSQNLSESEIELEAENVWRGKYGCGTERKQKLGDRYAEVQAMVNKKYYNR
jgi:cytoskeletal protein RodZ